MLGITDSDPFLGGNCVQIGVYIYIYSNPETLTYIYIHIYLSLSLSLGPHFEKKTLHAGILWQMLLALSNSGLGFSSSGSRGF